ncbi:MAG: GNAT family N-acetyltransferase [Polyangiaceae bacterium]
MTVALATPSDVDAAARILLEARLVSGDLASCVASLHDDLARPIARVTVAKDSEGVVVGVLVAWAVADEVTLMDVAITQASRRRGEGRALVEELLAFARSRGARLVVLEVRRGNAPAIALYERLGFVAVGVRRAYYDDGEDAVDMHAHVQAADANLAK